MDSAMRDLEQIREKDSGEGRPLALVGVLVLVTVALVLAMGVAVGGWSDADGVAADDPLARIDRSAGLEAQPPPDTDLPEVDRAGLTFPQLLAPDERPEVAAALAAAAAELAHPDPIEHLPAALPAGLALGPSSASIARAAAHDTLVAQAIAAEPAPAAAATVGRDGPYTVQVVSYDSAAGAEAFAEGLRSRGHRAFVTSAQVEGRGTMHRVRIGPFETLREAQAYRQTFERDERMSTLLVRRRTNET